MLWTLRSGTGAPSNGLTALSSWSLVRCSALIRSSRKSATSRSASIEALENVRRTPPHFVLARPWWPQSLLGLGTNSVGRRIPSGIGPQTTGFEQQIEVRQVQPECAPHRHKILGLASRKLNPLVGMAGRAGVRLLALAATAIFRPKALLIAENLCLR